MTRGEAIAKLKIDRDYLCKMSSMFDVNEVAKPFNMAIEALECKHGEWIEEEAGYFADSLYTAYCSNCRHYVNWFEDKYGGAIIKVLPNYCSNCGAKMKGSDEKDDC